MTKLIEQQPSLQFDSEERPSGSFPYGTKQPDLKFEAGDGNEPKPKPKKEPKEERWGAGGSPL